MEGFGACGIDGEVTTGGLGTFIGKVVVVNGLGWLGSLGGTPRMPGTGTIGAVDGDGAGDTEPVACPELGEWGAVGIGSLTPSPVTLGIELMGKFNGGDELGAGAGFGILEPSGGFC